MAQLFIVVLSIALLAIVIAGGVNYLNTDIGVRTETTRMVQTSRHSLESAFLAYRLANRGALPQPEAPGGDEIWLGELSGYAGLGATSAPAGMRWRYVEDAGVKSLCLVTEGAVTISDAVLSGLEQVDDEHGVIRTDCIGEGSKVALLLPLRITE